MTQFDKLYTSREKLVKTVLDLEEQISQGGGGGGSYPPSGGIPKTDLSTEVQTSLGLADSAYQKPETGIPGTDLASGVIPDVSGKKDKMAIAQASGTTLTAQDNTLYLFSSSVNTLAITLPAITDITHTHEIEFIFDTGGSPAVTFTDAGGDNVLVQEELVIDTIAKYELNALWAGKWIVAGLKLKQTGK